MFLLRSAQANDVSDIYEIARHLDTVNLPANRERIDEIVSLSLNSFGGTIDPIAREYLFVLEDTAKKRVIGTSLFTRSMGPNTLPMFFFHVRKAERYSESLDKYFVHQCLRIGYNYDGPTEIGGLILLPEYRRHPETLGAQLSYVRFLFIAMHRQWFRNKVLSELLPPLEENGNSILWEHVGRRFTGLSYQEADMLSKDNKEFIRTLFPHEVIYTALLPKEVQDVIGKVGPKTQGVEKLLRRIGFDYANQIDPFDGGPHFIAKTDRISLVQNARSGDLETATSDQDMHPALVAIESQNGEFSAIKTHARWNEYKHIITVSTKTDELVGNQPGSAWMVPWPSKSPDPS